MAANIYNAEPGKILGRAGRRIIQGAIGERMKIVHVETICSLGELVGSHILSEIEAQIREAISQVSWPIGEKGFFLDPASCKHGNGVKPIKDACVTYLKGIGWKDERRLRPKGVAGTGPLDVVRPTPHGLFAVEWETGNISSSHRALNKICLGVLDRELAGGVLILPSTALYPFLTDRIGNFRELIPYLPLWNRIPYASGVIKIIVVEQDGLKEGVPRISKGTDGRALL